MAPGHHDAANVIPLSPPIQNRCDEKANQHGKRIEIGSLAVKRLYFRGLEDDGVVDFHYAVEIAEYALHIYRANSHKPETPHFLGLVNTYLSSAVAGSRDSPVVLIGTVPFSMAAIPY